MEKAANLHLHEDVLLQVYALQSYTITAQALTLKTGKVPTVKYSLLPNTL